MADQLSAEKETVKLEKKLIKKYGKSFASELRGLSKSELDNKLLGLTNHNQEIITTKGRDLHLELAKDKYFELRAPYDDQVRANKEKSRFLHLLIKEKDLGGYSLGGADSEVPLDSNGEFFQDLEKSLG